MRDFQKIPIKMFKNHQQNDNEEMVARAGGESTGTSRIDSERREAPLNESHDHQQTQTW